MHSLRVTTAVSVRATDWIARSTCSARLVRTGWNVYVSGSARRNSLSRKQLDLTRPLAGEARVLSLARDLQRLVVILSLKLVTV